MERTSSATWVRGLAAMFAAQGLDMAQVAQAAGLAPARWQQPDARFDADEVTRLWNAAIAQSGEPCLGINSALAAKYVNFDVVGFAVLASADLRSGLDSLARYLALISSATTFALQPEGNNAWVVMGHTGTTLPVPWQRSAYSLLAVLTLCQWATRRDIHPLAAEFHFPAPADHGATAQAFGCPVRFGAADCRFLLAEADLARAIPSRDPMLLGLHERAMQERLSSLDATTLRQRVGDDIRRGLHLGEPRRQDVAARLGLTDRTLQRRLSAEGTSFQQLLDDTRRELARQHLHDHRLALTQVAGLLGFVDQSNFFRACKRWFGMSPSQFRAQPMAAPSGAAGQPQPLDG